MFRELTYSSGVISIVTCGTEIIYRVKERNTLTDYNYQIQSTYLIAVTGVQVIVSYLIFKNISKIKVTVLRLLTITFSSVLIVAIVLRSKYNFFMPLESQYTLYNVTSFFLCMQTITFGMLWFRNESENEEDSINLRQTNYQRRQQRSHDRSVATVNEYDNEIDYTLPSYSEIPAPPAYTKKTTVTSENLNSGTSEATNMAITIPETLPHSTQDNCETIQPVSPPSNVDVIGSGSRNAVYNRDNNAARSVGE